MLKLLRYYLKSKPESPPPLTSNYRTAMRCVRDLASKRICFNLIIVIMNSSFSTYPFSRPLYVMLKPAGPACNLKCDYCYYLQKTALYPDHKKYLMADDVLENFTRQYFASQTMREVMFTWHGGEALLRDIDFYRRALYYQQRYGKGFTVDNSIQTNGVLLTDEWCRFLKENNFLVGISLDGPEHCHDKYRRYTNDKPSFKEVMRGLSLLQKHNIEYNILSVVNDYNVDHPLECYNFFKQTGSSFVQYIPIVERIGNTVSGHSVSPDKWGNYLIAVFDEWVRKDVGRVFVQHFDSTLASWVGVAPSVCMFAKSCGHAAAMEFNGDLYSCDHFVYTNNKLGNIRTSNLTQMMYSQQQDKFGKAKFDTLPTKCLNCKFLFACYGECPKNRFEDTASGEQGLNYLCEGYYRYFEHVKPYMDFMKTELANQRSPMNVMKSIKAGYFRRRQ